MVAIDELGGAAQTDVRRDVHCGCDRDRFVTDTGVGEMSETLQTDLDPTGDAAAQATTSSVAAGLPDQTPNLPQAPPPLPRHASEPHSFCR